MKAAFVALVLVLLQLEGRDPATFRRRVAEFDSIAAARTAAAAPADRARLTLEWLRALNNVLGAIPFERADGPHVAWLKTHDDLLVYSEPAGQWLIGYDVLVKLHAEHAASAFADDIAWMAVTNGLPGECEGYVPCYAASLDQLEGEYLRRHATGAHRLEAFDNISASLRSVLDDLLKRPDRSDFLTVPRDCGDLLQSMRPLGAAIAAAGGAGTETMTLADRLIAYCPQLI